MRRWLSVFIAVLAVTAAASGCGQPGAGHRGHTENAENTPFAEPQYDWNKGTGETLVIWGIYPDMERSYIKRAFERFEELTEDRLEVVQIPKDEFERKMRDSEGAEEDRPDIILAYGGTNVEIFDPDERFYDFTDALWVDDLTDTAVSQTVYNGKVIGLPHWEASISGTLYNKKIFQKYHLEVPGTQEEFMDVCAKLLDHGITPMYMPASEISMLLYQFPLDSVVEDSDILRRLNQGEIGYSDLPEMEQIVTWYKIMADKGYFGEHYLTDDWNGMEPAMSSGEYAMMLCWDTWLYTDYKGDPSDFGLMPAFQGVPERGTFEGPNLGLFMVNKDSDKLDSALNFITFLADPYNYNAAFEGIYTAPVFKNQVASISTPQYVEAERLIERNYRNSIAWLRIRGFSQMDASCIREYMDPDYKGTAMDCLEDMDRLRDERLNRP